MRAASLEWPLAIRMAHRVPTRVDLTAGSDEGLSPHRPSKCLESAVLDPRRTAGSDLLGTDPSTPETMKLPVAVERSESPWLLVTERSSAELEGPSWMAGTHTASRCPKAWTWHLSTWPWGPDTAIQTWWVVCWWMCGSPQLANTGRRRSMAIVHSVFSVWPTLDRESAWMLCTPDRWTGTNVIALQSHHLSSRIVICISVYDRVPPSFLMKPQSSRCRTSREPPGNLRWGRMSLTVDDGLHLQKVEEPWIWDADHSPCVEREPNWASQPELDTFGKRVTSVSLVAKGRPCRTVGDAHQAPLTAPTEELWSGRSSSRSSGTMLWRPTTGPEEDEVIPVVPVKP